MDRSSAQQVTSQPQKKSNIRTWGKNKLEELRLMIGCPSSESSENIDLYQAILQHRDTFVSSKNKKGLELKDWKTSIHKQGFREMASSFLEQHGPHFWPDSQNDRNFRNLTYSKDYEQIKHLLKQLYWRISNPEDDQQSHNAETPLHTYVSDSTGNQAGHHPSEPIDVDNQVSHQNMPAYSSTFQAISDENTLPSPLPQSITRTSESLDDELPANTYPMPYFSEKIEGRGVSLPRVQAPMPDMGNTLSDVAESPMTAQDDLNGKRPATQAELELNVTQTKRMKYAKPTTTKAGAHAFIRIYDNPVSGNRAKQRASLRRRKPIERSDYLHGSEVDKILDGNSSSSSDEYGEMLPVDQGHNNQGHPLPRPLTPPGGREGTVCTLGRLDHDHTEHPLHRETCGASIAESRPPSPELDTGPAPPPWPQQEIQSNHVDSPMETVEFLQGTAQDNPGSDSETPICPIIESDGEAHGSHHDVTQQSQAFPELIPTLSFTLLNNCRRTFQLQGTFRDMSLRDVMAMSNFQGTVSSLTFTLTAEGLINQWTMSPNEGTFERMKLCYIKTLNEAIVELRKHRNNGALLYNIHVAPGGMQDNELERSVNKVKFDVRF